jgi:Zn-dependent protease with chaperone function
MLFSQLKALFVVFVFSAISIVSYFVCLIYGFILTFLLSSVYVFAFGIFGLVVGYFFDIFDRSTPLPIDLLALALFLFSLALLFIFIIISIFVFIFNPVRFQPATKILSKKDKASKSIFRDIEAVATALDRKPFDYVVEGERFFVSTLSSGTKLILIVDVDLDKFLSRDEIRAIIAHEYGHFENGNEFSYRFLRRCQVSCNFLASQINDPAGESYFQKIIGWSLILVPNVMQMRRAFLSLFNHISRIMVHLYQLAVSATIWVFRDDFYSAEFLADKVASSSFGTKAIIEALVKISALQLAAYSGARDSPDAFQRRWFASSKVNTITHPSIRNRIRLVSDVDDVDYANLVKSVYNSWTSKISTEERFTNHDDPRRFAMQRICFPQLAPAISSVKIKDR